MRLVSSRTLSGLWKEDNEELRRENEQLIDDRKQTNEGMQNDPCELCKHKRKKLYQKNEEHEQEILLQSNKIGELKTSRQNERKC